MAAALIALLGGAAVFGVVHLCRHACDTIEDRFVYHDEGYGRALTRFHDDARARGVSGNRAVDELLMREYLAKLRRVASNAVRGNPTNWYSRLMIAKADVLGELAVTRSDLAAELGQLLATLSYGHILYPEEARLVDHGVKVKPPTVSPTPDQIAALQIVP